MKLNEQIREHRKKIGLTQEQVAGYLGVSAPAVNKWESGVSHSQGYHTTNPRLHYFQNIKFWRYSP